MTSKIQQLLFFISCFLLLTASLAFNCNTESEFHSTSLLGFKINNDMLPCVYSGFINISENKVFFILIKSHVSKYLTSSTEEDIVIWHNEPGRSFIKSMLLESSFFKFDSNYNIIYDAANALMTNVDMLYIDYPGETGYSKGSNYSTLEEIKLGFNSVLEKINNTNLINLKTQAVFLLGHSYLIPHFAKGLQESSQFKDLIKIQKVALINSVLDFRTKANARSDLIKGLNVISLWDEPEFNYLKERCNYEITNIKNESDLCSQLDDYILKISGDLSLSDVRISNFKENEVDNAIHSLMNNERYIRTFNINPEEIKKDNNLYWMSFNPEVQDSLKLTSFYFDYNQFKSSSFHIYILSGQYNLEYGLHEDMVDNLIPELSKESKGYWKIPLNTYKEYFMQVPENTNIIKGFIKQTDNFTYLLFKDAGKYIGFDDKSSFSYFMNNYFLNTKTNNINCIDDVEVKTNELATEIKKDTNVVDVQFNNETKNVVSIGKGGCLNYIESCNILNNCNGNGVCDNTTNGLCSCFENFYGPACSLGVNSLNKQTKVSISPSDVRIFSPQNSFDFIISDNLLFEIESTKPNIIVSIVRKTLHYDIFDYTKHMYYQRVNDKTAFYLDQKEVSDVLIVLSNIDSINDVEVSFNLCNFNTKSTEIFGPGGIGFILALFFFALGLASYIATTLLNKNQPADDSSYRLSKDIEKNDKVETFNNKLMSHVFGKEIITKNN